MQKILKDSLNYSISPCIKEQPICEIQLFNWGWILERNLDDSLQSFPPFYLQSSLQLCLEISISSNSFNLLRISSSSHNLFRISTVQHCKGERRKTINPSLWFKKSIQKTQVWEHSKLCPETSMKLYVHEFGFCTRVDEGVFKLDKHSYFLWARGAHILGLHAWEN